MNEDSLTFLRSLLDAPGPSGFESAPASIWRKEASAFADSVDHDVLGNSIARLAVGDAPVVVIEGHIDEIGLLITHIDAEGFCWFGAVGGWDAAVLVGQRVVIANDAGPVHGVIGRKASHLLEQADRDKTPRIADLWIDIGASDRSDAMSRVAVGDPAVIHASFLQITDDLVVSRSLDNRVGAYVALEALRPLASDRPRLDVYAVAATLEEISYAGAAVSSFRLKPDVGIALDVTHATDYPGADKKRNDEVKLGGGPVLCRGAGLNNHAFRAIQEVARTLGLEAPVQAAPGKSWTDADAMIPAAAGVASVLVSIPNRYMHSPNEMVSLSDLQRTVELVVAFVRSLESGFDFRL